MPGYPLYSFVIGGLFILSLYNLLYFLYLHERNFLALSVFILGFGLEIGKYSELWHYSGFLAQHLAAADNTFAFIMLAASISLASYWLEVRQYLPHIDNLLRLTFWISLLMIPFHWWVGYGVAFAGCLALALLILFVTAIVLRYRRGLQITFTLSTGFLLVILVASLQALELVSDMPMLIDGMYLIVVVVIILSLTQAKRIAAASHAKDEFLITMSHELRTPLNTVVNTSRLLKLTPLSSQQHEYVSHLNTSAQHMLALINNVLNLAQLDSSLLRMEETPFHLTDVLHQIEELLTEQACHKQLKLDISHQCHPLNKQLVGNPTHLQQVLLNLTSNAIKFTPQGRVSLTVTPQEVTNDNARLLFEIRDSGIGIRQEDTQKLFQPFSQLDDNIAWRYGGSGLGLAISHKLVQHMGGELRVESQPGQGSLFFFTLDFPLREPQCETHINMPTIPPPSLSGTLRILLVDDDAMNRFFGRELIRSLGIRVEVADSGETALQLLQEQSFDLVFMDVSMPGMDGYETTRQLRINKKLHRLPVLALTAHSIRGERERCLAAGMDDYLTKPFDIDQLETAIWRWHRQSV